MPFKRLRVFLSLFCLFTIGFNCLSPSTALATSSTAIAISAQVSIQSIQDQLQGLKNKLNSIQNDEASVSAQTNSVNLAVQQLSIKLSNIEEQNKELEAAHKKKIALFQAYTRQRYKADSDSVLEFLLGSGNFSTFLDHLYYLNAISHNDLVKAKELHNEQVALDKEKKQTLAVEQQLQKLLNDLAEKAATLASEKLATQSALDTAQQQQYNLELQLAAEQAAANAAAQKGAGKVYNVQCPTAPSGQISFCGHGWGHGVGLAQYGALGMSQNGFGWQDILKHFYTGISIQAHPTQPLRIYLSQAGNSISPRISPATIQDSAGNVLGNINIDTTVVFSLVGGNVQAKWGSSQVSGQPLRLVPTDTRNGLFQVSGSGTRYRGEAWVDGSSGLKVVNHIDSENYVRGLAEVPSSWPLNALAAQMVAARTYAIYHINSNSVYDMDDTTQYQVYGGFDREVPSQDLAVQATSNQVMFYNNQIINAFFSSSDGGHSQCASQEWGAGENPCTPSYLQGVVDQYDVSPLHTWYTPAYTPAQIQGFLSSAYDSNSCGTLQGFDLSSRDASDRLKVVNIIGSKGICSISPGAFMRAFNAGSPSNATIYGDMLGSTPGNAAWPYW